MALVPRGIRRRLKPFYHGGRRAVARTFCRYSPERLERCLRTLGVAAGDTVLLHSGFHATSGFTGSPADAIAVFDRVVGPDGNLVMMSMPYRGASEAYAAREPVFDLLRTPSAVGLLSELFRRQADVERSLNPLHPVLARGPLAAWIVADHEQSAYSCGRGSPFERFLSLDGKLVFYDAPYSSMTYMHHVEDKFQDRLPVALYAPQPATLRVRDRHGRETGIRQYFFSEAARGRRHFAPIERALLDAGAMRRARIGNSTVLCVRARDVTDCAAKLLDDGAGFYT